ncbi:MAG: B12-binding domain-containing radical SAM protein, partial [Candidatus Bathyarchaeia archaeon]
LEFTRLLKESGIKINWVASSRVNTISQGLMRAMAEVGLDTLYFGVETGSQRVLDLMGKAAKLEQAVKSFEIAKQEGVKPMGAFILGYPGETLDEMMQTIKFAINLDPDYAQFSVLTPYPGTPVYDELRAKGLLLTEDWDKYTVLEPLIKYERFGYTAKDVGKMLRKAYYMFYFRPSYLRKHSHMIPVAIKTLFNAQIMPWLKRFFQGFTRTSRDYEYDSMESLAANLPREGDLRVS